jgi:alkylation response protein AidB-like acyl-CoA dehydrogenase
MSSELNPVTPEGASFVELCEHHLAEVGGRAAEHDRDGSFPLEELRALQESKAMAACVPAELGGLGVRSLHDLVVGINRLARADGSLAIAVNMHAAACWLLAFLGPRFTARGNQPVADAMTGLLAAAGSGVVFGLAGSEPGADFLHPLTTASRCSDGWILNGRKSFVTSSPVAGLFVVRCRVEERTGPQQGFAMVARSTPGVAVKETWDALGMRASASHDLVLHDCRLPEAAVLVDSQSWGAWSRVLLLASIAGIGGIIGVALGLAEAARDFAMEFVTTRRRAPSNRLLAERYPTQQRIAEIQIDLAAARAMLTRTYAAVDAYLGDGEDQAVEDLHRVHAEVQSAKAFVQRKAIDIVDGCLAASGGSGYLNRSPLSRLYRDVRAGPFMQPLSPSEAPEYIGRVTLGLPP